MIDNEWKEGSCTNLHELWGAPFYTYPDRKYSVATVYGYAPILYVWDYCDDANCGYRYDCAACSAKYEFNREWVKSHSQYKFDGTEWL